MADTLPTFEPLLLTNLRYGEAVKQMKATGCAIRRAHWCTPVLTWEGDYIAFNDDGEISEWEPDMEDMSAADWLMVPAPTPSKEG